MAGEQGVLAFDILWAPVLGHARWVICDARGSNLGGPALGFAMRAVEAALGSLVSRRGRIFGIENCGTTIAKTVLPAVGARAPQALRVRLGPMRGHEGDVVTLELDATFPPLQLRGDAVRALELGELLREADEALACGEVDVARRAYVSALEQAPRHPEISRIIAEIDAVAGDREESALALLSESMPLEMAGAVAAELLFSAKDLDAAKAALSRAAEQERFAPLAASLWLRMAEIEPSEPARGNALDRAVACSPAYARARWARVDYRLSQGEAEAALTDCEQLEAGVAGARARHDVLSRSARRFLEQGFIRDAGKLFERSLRYAPDDVSATAGLARALLEAGRPERAIPLLNRAVSLSARAGDPDVDALLDLARLLAEIEHDLPQAVARARQVPSASPRAAEARFREAQWRAALGDHSGASMAFARLREAVELGRERRPIAAGWLAEAARFEGEVQGDWPAAERYLGEALRLLPNDEEISRAYREAAAKNRH
jgi:tetratricopeptide (TPR) repeat protein